MVSGHRTSTRQEKNQRRPRLDEEEVHLMHPRATGKARKYTDLTLAILRKEAGLGGDQATSSTRLPTLEKNSSTTALPIKEELARLEFRKYF
jgi:hypothetical protein